ncbi:MAG: ATPase [Acidimicrobiaceae bacterium]|nr:ATPase [Acidimicrobiaceae bacterium]
MSGWSGYSGLSVRSGVTGRADPRDGVLAPGEPLRPELADVARLGRHYLRRVLGTARIDDAQTPARMLATHLGPLVSELPVVGETWPNFDHVNVQLALDHWFAEPSRSHRLVGLIGFEKRMFSFGDLIGPQVPFAPALGSVAMVSVPSGPGGRTLPCVRCGIYFVTDDRGPLALLVREAQGHGPRTREGIRVEVMAADQVRADDVLHRLRELALVHNAYRGNIVSFGAEMFGPGDSVLSFQERPRLERDDLVLPEGTLERVEQQVLGVARHRAWLRASGQHLKRGVLLYGPPGTGKTHTIRYLLSRLEGSTVVLLSGSALGHIASACSVARALQPSVVVIEDVDLIAEQRGMHPGEHPLLFQLMNEMDGLGEDVDVAFLLTTNRVDLLEPALAARPGRVDEAVEIPIPDATARRALVELYRGSLALEADALDAAVSRTEGVTASFLKELLRRAALISALGSPTGEPPALRTAALSEALDQLLDDRSKVTRAILGGSRDAP